MKPIATQVIGLLSKSKTLFLPNRFEKALINWLTNIED
jgi:valyl-tRNA synthetase